MGRGGRGSVLALAEVGYDLQSSEGTFASMVFRIPSKDQAMLPPDGCLLQFPGGRVHDHGAPGRVRSMPDVRDDFLPSDVIGPSKLISS